MASCHMMHNMNAVAMRGAKLVFENRQVCMAEPEF